MSLPLATLLAATPLPKLSRRIIGLTQIDGRFEYSFRKLNIFSTYAKKNVFWWDRKNVKEKSEQK